MRSRNALVSAIAGLAAIGCSGSDSSIPVSQAKAPPPGFVSTPPANLIAQEQGFASRKAEGGKAPPASGRGTASGIKASAGHKSSSITVTSGP